MSSMEILTFLQEKLVEADSYLNEEVEGSAGYLQELARVELIEEILDFISEFSEKADV